MALTDTPGPTPGPEQKIGWLMDLLATVLGTTEAVTDVRSSDEDTLEITTNEDDGTIGMYEIRVRKVGTADPVSGYQAQP